MMKKLIATIGVFLVMTLCDCASIMHGTEQEETFISKPDSANIKVDNISHGKTPTTVRLTRAKEHTVNISLSGYKPANLKLKKTISGWYFGNVLLGGVIGLIVDAGDGAIYNLEPDLDIESAKNIVQDEVGENTLTITLRKNVAEKDKGRKVGQLDRLTT